MVFHRFFSRESVKSSFGTQRGQDAHNSAQLLRTPLESPDGSGGSLHVNYGNVGHLQ